MMPKTATILRYDLMSSEITAIRRNTRFASRRTAIEPTRALAWGRAVRSNSFHDSELYLHPAAGKCRGHCLVRPGNTAAEAQPTLRIRMGGSKSPPLTVSAYSNGCRASGAIRLQHYTSLRSDSKIAHSWDRKGVLGFDHSARGKTKHNGVERILYGRR